MMVAVFIGYIGMYHLYGKFLARKIFRIADNSDMPSRQFEDGVDFVPSKKEVIFGHHFTSIAGTGPIVGPAIAIIWGWVPAVLWIFFGSVFMGAVHDFGSLVVSLRNEGKSLSDYTSRYINNRTRFLFFVIVFLELWIVIAVFGLVIAIIFSMFPASVIPVWIEIPIAMGLGYLVTRKNKSLTVLSIVALLLMYLSIGIGYFYQFSMPKEIWGIPATGVWTIILLIYAYFASVLPVTTLLQPRDFINSHQLIVALVLLVSGVIAATFMLEEGLNLVAPAVQLHPAEAPSMMPFLFITIACGAISGFHSLVSSGTSSKQISNEKDSLFIGYGSMLAEGVLATLVIIAVAAGIGIGYDNLTGFDAWNKHYSSWTAAKGLPSKINAFVIGSANLLDSLGIPHLIAVTVMGVFVASFASTTLDSATRIQRYVVSELFEQLKLKPLANRYISTAFVVVSAAALAFITGANGKGALKLWPLFGAVNQTLAALALVVITIYLKEKYIHSDKKTERLYWVLTGVPALFMSVITLYAGIENEVQYIRTKNHLLTFIEAIIIFIVIWIIVEGANRFFRIESKNGNAL